MCELCKSKFCGKSPCRRCKCGFKRASAESTTYYYGDYCRATRFPWSRRVIEEHILQEIEEEEEERATVATTRSQEVGFTGLPILYRLTRLYGFDIQRDCVIGDFKIRDYRRLDARSPMSGRLDRVRSVVACCGAKTQVKLLHYQLRTTRN